MSKKVIGILQARIGSTRLPGKVLAPILGKPMLAVILDRLAASEKLSRLVVATSVSPIDDPIVKLAQDRGTSFYRGSEEDCLDRYYRAAEAFSADIVVRLTADNPLVDAAFLDWAITQFVAANPPCDYASSSLSNSFPLGLSVEVLTFGALAEAWHEDNNPCSREHVTPFIYRNPQRFAILKLTNSLDYSYLRWTVDTLEDLELVRRVFEHFGHDLFPWSAAITALTQHPEWREINQQIHQRSWTL